MRTQPTAIYLQTYLAPIAPLLARPDVTDIFINRPQEVWVESLGGGIDRLDVPELDETTLWRLARQIASMSSQGVSREHPILGATLPSGERVQIIAPPATRGPMAFAVRKHVVSNLSLENYDETGAFLDFQLDGEMQFAALNKTLSDLLRARKASAFLKLAVQHRKNIVVAGGTSTGKTTFLNALLKEIPKSERLIVIEDSQEVQIDHPNAIGLLAVRGETGEARVSVEELVQASLRMRPDRIILGEIRGREATSFLRAVNTGHPGSITTIHADSPRTAIDQLCLLVLQSGLQMSRADITDYVGSAVDVFVQLARKNGRRQVSEIVFKQMV